MHLAMSLFFINLPKRDSSHKRFHSLSLSLIPIRVYPAHSLEFGQQVWIYGTIKSAVRSARAFISFPLIRLWVPLARFAFSLSFSDFTSFLLAATSRIQIFLSLSFIPTFVALRSLYLSPRKRGEQPRLSNSHKTVSCGRPGWLMCEPRLFLLFFSYSSLDPISSSHFYPYTFGQRLHYTGATPLSRFGERFLFYNPFSRVVSKRLFLHRTVR